jgi:hypothetical protein
MIVHVQNSKVLAAPLIICLTLKSQLLFGPHSTGKGGFHNIALSSGVQ